MNMAMIPCCTGDSHTGRIIRKQKINGRQNFYRFQGQRNFDAAVDFLLAQFPNVHTLWFMGTSAGAGGVGAQYANLRNRFVTAQNPNRQVHLIEDSSPSVAIEPGHWDNLTVWQTVLPGSQESGCTAPPPTRPTVTSPQAMRRGAPSRSARAAPTGPIAQTSSMAQAKPVASPLARRTTPRALSSSLANDTPTPELAYPFPDTEAVPGSPPTPPLTSLSRRSGSRGLSTQDIDPEANKNAPDPAGCYLLNDARRYNRSLDPNARYSILSFYWDNILTPKRTTEFYTAYQTAMMNNDAQIAAMPGPTRRLYINNTESRITPPPDTDDPNAPIPLCGRHVVTNFGPFDVSGVGLVDFRLQDAHYNFLWAMVWNEGAWLSNLNQPLTDCPPPQSDTSYTSF